MTISDRYRDLVNEAAQLVQKLDGTADDKAVQGVRQGLAGLEELKEQVGEIPRIRLEVELTPVLLAAHTRLDRARLLLEEAGAEDLAVAVWDVEQKIYRLLNEL
ncbi:MAG: hypothetical protein AB7F21_12960 [Desulfuromonadales bacterium]|uniref:hypothetical protein n=1 Tax=Desulfuromonas sp. KJ2020 TaxID=2919173 RepID=UPI0020A7DAA0|nr:hypothetical protein [Desulfuromonas sp. KJ2020]MCP3176915.1 hypothetical protein [Desulfuromonas sp. KJ2020]